jgi:hypothetical protein
MFFSPKNPAKRRYLRSSFGIMLSYLGLVEASSFWAHRWHPQGWHLYLAAALPTIPLLCFAFVVGRYLREERDEYERDLLIRGMLWGTAIVLSVSIFSSFLRAYGWQGSLPPFTEFVLFWAVAGVSKFVHRVANRVADDE